MTVGFDPRTYSVNEGDGSVSLTIVATGGVPPANSVIFYTQDDTATCKKAKHTAYTQFQ